MAQHAECALRRIATGAFQDIGVTLLSVVEAFASPVAVLIRIWGLTHVFGDLHGDKLINY